jgi:hypothetical protein
VTDRSKKEREREQMVLGSPTTTFGLLWTKSHFEYVTSIEEEEREHVLLCGMLWGEQKMNGTKEAIGRR